MLLQRESYLYENHFYSRMDTVTIPREEYEKLVPRITEHMNALPYVDSEGRIYKFGEFFPIELSPVSYNESPGQDHFPLTKDQAIAQGYVWRDENRRNLKITKRTDDLPDHIKDIEESIRQEVVECEHKGQCNERCTNAFRIIPVELEFYKTTKMALPRLCPNCRNSERLLQQSPINLWHQKCMCGSTKKVYKNKVTHFHGSNSCMNEFETSYPPESPLIIYCQDCYQSEVR